MAENIQATEEQAEYFDVSEKDIFKFTSDFPAATGQGIPNMKNTGLSEFTYVDCGNVFSISHDDFDKSSKEGKIVFSQKGSTYCEITGSYFTKSTAYLLIKLSFR